MASIRKRVTKAAVAYDVHYRDMTGASRQKSFRRKAEAEKFRATVVATRPVVIGSTRAAP